MAAHAWPPSESEDDYSEGSYDPNFLPFECAYITFGSRASVGTTQNPISQLLVPSGISRIEEVIAYSANMPLSEALVGWIWWVPSAPL